ncbi:radical SAM/SPASM domain-containing protein [Clostridium omnivorum]|uniref:Radical SAM/SPASM domain-containing protein n=1 Tax=Clostridium omnivorum TaxID=1604902 RepID=A0ABQ5N4H5_9CLOT|nr:radical SAM protein [Clostridium sp. E14]GLC30103.1 radical SAM/SPASM domain-containing protein [Clostridium sp. E14]
MLERVVISITNRCNLHCIHCYANSGQEDSNTLTTTELERIVEQVARSSAQYLIISGGEPMLTPDRLECVAINANKLGLKTILTTNGTLIDSHTAKWLKRLKIDTVQISLDSDRAEEHEFIRGKGTFRSAVNGIQTIVDNGLNCHIMMVAFKHNVERISSLAILSKELGVNLLAVDRFVPTGRGKFSDNLDLSKDELIKLHSQVLEIKNEKYIPISTNDPICNAIYLKRMGLQNFDWAKDANLGCTAGTRLCMISANGVVYPCTFINVPIGNIRENNLKDILENSPLITALKERDKFKGKCGNCNVRYICGGCRAHALSTYKDILEEDPCC